MVFRQNSYVTWSPGETPASLGEVGQNSDVIQTKLRLRWLRRSSSLLIFFSSSPPFCFHPSLKRNDGSIYRFSGVIWPVNRQEIRVKYGVVGWTADIESLDHIYFHRYKRHRKRNASELFSPEIISGDLISGGFSFWLWWWSEKRLPKLVVGDFWWHYRQFDCQIFPEGGEIRLKAGVGRSYMQ
ncbi:hypothetical protein MA16_Dca001903 [Dendrobium catenatum]|uniref:Uncharacterized protein n=1 Tax=Dendrobium catenatum TaxID=906689 RepID=A0A2I0XDT9_9ASPA|nr:hypothetical protein MA16_Dca001903 [Dendrobium catenatum]